MGSADSGSTWLGLERVGDDEWRLPVTDGVRSGARALFGGCATAAAIAIAREIAEQPIVFAASHFGSMAQVGTTAILRSRVIAAGRTTTHLEVEGKVDGTHSFLTRLTAGVRPPKEVEGQWVHPAKAASFEKSAPFPHPVHNETWAERFNWRLAHVSRDGRPVASWWVRPRETLDPLIAGTILVDYVTYGIGRALGTHFGGLSIDNVVRVHRIAEADWYLLQVMPEAIYDGLGYGTARLYANNDLVMTGTQSIVVMDWDWRLPGERELG